MLINRRNGLMAGGGLSAKSYVQDGLVAMWDGIENAGWGLHDSGAKKWKDLIGSNDLNESVGVWTFDDSSWGCAAVQSALFLAATPGVEVSTCEVVASCNKEGSYATMMALGFYSRELNWRNQNICFGCHASGNSINASDLIGPKFSCSIDYSSAQYASAVKVNGLDRALSTTRTGWNRGTSAIGRAYISSSTALATQRHYCIRIYNRILTVEEKSINYAVDKARFNLPDAM